jgi:GNAT superfamily N-acetyltransferase
MSAKNSLNAIQFHYSPFNEDEDSAEITAFDVNTGLKVGNLAWSEKQLEHVSVSPAYQRQGIATEMWKRAMQAHKNQPLHYPKPIPSRFRTKPGDEWAWSIYNKNLSERPEPNDYNWDEDEDELLNREES